MYLLTDDEREALRIKHCLPKDNNKNRLEQKIIDKALEKEEEKFKKFSSKKYF